VPNLTLAARVRGIVNIVFVCPFGGVLAERKHGKFVTPLCDKIRYYLPSKRCLRLSATGKISGRIRHLQAEIDASINEMERLKKEYAATEERLRKLKREFVFTGGRS